MLSDVLLKILMPTGVNAATQSKCYLFTGYVGNDSGRFLVYTQVPATTPSQVHPAAALSASAPALPICAHSRALNCTVP